MLYKFFMSIWPFSLFGLIKLPRPAAIVPEFELPDKLVDGEFIYNPEYYATRETAAKIQQRFNALVLFSKAIQDIDRMAPPQWFVRFEDGTEVNAGQLAKFFASYPEEKYPGIAVRFGLSYIGMLREEKRRPEVE